MSLKDVDIGEAMRRLADRKIESAMRDGKFDNLRGAGKPLDLDPAPADENARLTWWALRILKQNDVTPDEVRWRKQVDLLRDELARATTEARVTTVVAAINRLVKQLNTLGTNALKSPVAPASLEDELARLGERMALGGAAAKADAAPPASPAGSAGTVRQCVNPVCRSRNAKRSRFCRRCGSALAAA